MTGEIGGPGGLARPETSQEEDGRPSWVAELLVELRGVGADGARPAWVDELLTELRRAGRAAVAARAAAESCEQRLESSAVARAEPTSSGAAHAASTDAAPEHVGRAEGDDHGVVRLVEALLPTVDALARMSVATAPSEPRGLWQRLGRGRELAELKALRDGITVLDAQLTSALEACGVSLDREVGGPVDGDRHRIVETVAVGPGEPSGRVRAVVRAGVSFGGRRLREADVIVTR